MNCARSETLRVASAELRIASETLRADSRELLAASKKLRRKPTGFPQAVHSLSTGKES